MDDLLSLDILSENIDYNLHTQEFKEFCSNLNSLGVITNPRLYIESMEDHNKSFIAKMKDKKILSNARKTTGDVKKAYDNVTDGGGSLIRAVWDMSMKGIQLASKILKFILINLAKIPKMIVSIVKTIGRIPQNVRNKIRGNISLYITVNDVNSLYKTLIPVIDTFLDNADEVCKGTMWGTFFNRRPAGSKIPSKYILTENDMAYHKKMKSAYEKLKLIEFKETIVKLEDPNVVNIYFGGTKSIKYKNASGNVVESTYYDALAAVLNEFQEQSEFLKSVQTDIGEKFDKSQMNQAFARLDTSAQQTVGDTIQMISKVINIIGNLLRYTIIDMKTIRNSADKILSKENITKVKNESVIYDYTKFTKEEHQAMMESWNNVTCVEEYGGTFDQMYYECVSLFEESSKKIDKKTERSLTPEEEKEAQERFGKRECSIMKDKYGYYAKTHRAWSGHYDSIAKLPKGKVKFVSSTD